MRTLPYRKGDKMKVYEAYLAQTGFLRVTPWFLFLLVVAGYALGVVGFEVHLPKIIGAMVLIYGIYFLTRVWNISRCWRDAQSDREIPSENVELIKKTLDLSDHDFLIVTGVRGDLDSRILGKVLVKVGRRDIGTEGPRPVRQNEA